LESFISTSFNTCKYTQEIDDSFNLELLSSVNQVSTQYVDNSQNSNLMIDLMFLHTNVEKFNNYTILLNLWSLFDHASLSVCIIIEKETIQDKKQTVVKNSKNKKEFVNKLRNRISHINMTSIHNYELLEGITQEFASITEY